MGPWWEAMNLHPQRGTLWGRVCVCMSEIKEKKKKRERAREEGEEDKQSEGCFNNFAVGERRSRDFGFPSRLGVV